MNGNVNRNINPNIFNLQQNQQLQAGGRYTQGPSQISPGNTYTNQPSPAPKTTKAKGSNGRRRTKTNDKNASRKVFNCHKCGKFYASSGNLKRHLRYECGVPPSFECLPCTKRFQHRHSLKIHLQTCHKIELEEHEIIIKAVASGSFEDPESQEIVNRIHNMVSPNSITETLKSPPVISTNANVTINTNPNIPIMHSSIKPNENVFNVQKASQGDTLPN